MNFLNFLKFDEEFSKISGKEVWVTIPFKDWFKAMKLMIEDSKKSISIN